MKKRIMAAFVVFVAGSMAGILLPQVQSRGSMQERPEPAMTTAFLFGKTTLKPGVVLGGLELFFPNDISHIEWWLGTADGKQLRKLQDPKTGRIAVRPLGQTVILQRDNDRLTLLGPDGGDLVLRLNDGPLAMAKIQDPAQHTTTFTFSPDSKHLYFVNGRERLCRIEIATRQLTELRKLAGAVEDQGIQFSPDGTKIAYSAVYPQDQFSLNNTSINVANADGTAVKKLAEFNPGQLLGFGYLPDGRLAVSGAYLDKERQFRTSVQAFNVRSGEAKTLTDPVADLLTIHSFGCFQPDGSTFLYEEGNGSGRVKLKTFDVKSRQVTAVHEKYLKSLQPMVWVRTPAVP